MTDYSHMFNPFRKKTENPAVEEETHLHSEILEFASTAYYAKFVAWLEREALKPLKIGNHADMIQSSVRANTLREIRDTLVKRAEVARAAMMADKE